VIRAAAIAAAAALACGGDRPARITRSDRDAATVAVVDRPRAGGSGPATPEREPNDAPDPAAAVAAPTNTGVLDGAGDVDLYPVAVDRPAVLTVGLSAMAGIDGALELRGADGAKVVAVDSAGAGGAEALPNWPVAPGRYYVAVREIARKAKPKRGVDAGAGRLGASPPYTLTVGLADGPAPDAEREPNDDRGAATALDLATTATGWLGWAGDVDVWKLDVLALGPGDGLDVAVTAVPKVALTVELTDAGGRSLVRQVGAAGAAVAIKNLAPQVAPGEPAAHYVVIGGKPASGVAYQLTVISRVLDAGAEAEPNDRADRANPLGTVDDDTGTMRGELGPGQRDHFVLAPRAAAAVLDLAVDGPPGLAVALTVTGGAIGTGTRSGDRVAATGLAVAPGQPVVIALSAPKGATPAGPYRLRWSLSPPAVDEPTAPDEPDPGDDPMPPEL
jgi:hypothetical protein